ncbi:MAG: type II toxin-antitoxin system Phd/YefM family antitoxin [Bacteroidota bacterium]|nr:type II toxin-antitoxin system Phd/YefM family antitoxin [Bacteroidota bacterium]
MSTITLPVTEAKQRFTELVKGAEESFDRYLVTKNGKDAAVILSAEEYENLLETLDILANKKEVRAIAEGSAQVKRGETLSLSKYLASKKKTHKGNNKF